ncbi:hypothetical protein [Dongshaea marina]|uniref:hypothetical protein n=1 Tax=Dongshaea marina TaxID=2047966 RepID=UPI000D3E7D79|nr:hypothetical protein [Dongshaea marina]
MSNLLSRIVPFAIGISLASQGVYADDTELFVKDLAAGSNYQPKVMIIFDNSGSMSSSVELAKAAYDPSTTYSALNNNDNSSYNTNYIYYSLGTDPVPYPNATGQRFLSTYQGCDTGRQVLENQGLYTGQVKRYLWNSRNWNRLRYGRNIRVVDCLDDMNNLNPNNSQAFYNKSVPVIDGYPKNGLANQPYSATLGSEMPGVFSTGASVTLYTLNYLRWYHAPSTETSTRMQVAKDAVSRVVASAPGVDFGLTIFNLDYPYEGDRDGGRIVRRITTNDQTGQTTLLNTVDALDPRTNTPLCETLYEVYRYYAGRPVWFGDDDSNYSNWYTGNQPPADRDAMTGESMSGNKPVGGTYTSAFFGPSRSPNKIDSDH